MTVVLIPCRNSSHLAIARNFNHLKVLWSRQCLCSIRLPKLDITILKHRKWEIQSFKKRSSNQYLLSSRLQRRPSSKKEASNHFRHQMGTRLVLNGGRLLINWTASRWSLNRSSSTLCWQAAPPRASNSMPESTQHREATTSSSHSRPKSLMAISTRDTSNSLPMKTTLHRAPTSSNQCTPSTPWIKPRTCRCPTRSNSNSSKCFKSRG